MTNQIINGNQNTTLLLNQLKAAKDQYPSLNKKQERELIKKHKSNRAELNKLLFMHNVKLVFNMAKKYMSKTLDFDGLVQDGMIGLSEAVNRFDINKDIKFCTYAYIWIKKYMTMNFYGKQVEIDKRSTSLNAHNICSTEKSNNGNEITLENYVNEYVDPSYYKNADIEDQLSSNEQKDICKKLMQDLDADSSLSSTEKAIFVDIFYNKEKPKDIVEKYNVTTKDISNIKSNVLAKFKSKLIDEYHIMSYDDLT